MFFSSFFSLNPKLFKYLGFEKIEYLGGSPFPFKEKEEETKTPTKDALRFVPTNAKNTHAVVVYVVVVRTQEGWNWRDGCLRRRGKVF